MFQHLKSAAFCLIIAIVLAGNLQAQIFVPSDLNLGDQYHVAFVTNSGRNAVSSDIADYNAFVQGEAESGSAVTANWGVQWFAVASTETVNAIANVPVGGAPIYLLNDTRVADDASDLWDGSIQVPINVNQSGDFESGSNIWTGTETNGLGIFGSELGTFNPEYGNSSIADSGWVTFGTFDEFTDLSAFYAISEVLTVAADTTCDFDG